MDQFQRLGLALQAVIQRLALWAADTAAFNALLLEVFAQRGPSSATEALHQELLTGRFLPAIELLDNQAMAGAMGAYTSSAHVDYGNAERIYLNSDWLKNASTTQIEAVLLEEIGHAIDQRLNPEQDSAGDEGEIFSALIRGVAPSLSATTENDQRLITVNNYLVPIEAASTDELNALAIRALASFAELNGSSIGAILAREASNFVLGNPLNGIGIPLLEPMLAKAAFAYDKANQISEILFALSDQQEAIIAALQDWQNSSVKDLQTLQNLLNQKFTQFGTDAQVNTYLNEIGELRFAVQLNRQGNGTQALTGDLGLGALGISTRGNASISAANQGIIEYGIDRNGLFIATDKTNEITLSLNASIPDAIFSAHLGPLDFAVNDEDADSIATNNGLDIDGDGLIGSHAGINIAIDLLDPHGGNKLRISDLLSNPLAAFAFNASGGGSINLDLKTTIDAAGLIPEVSTRFGMDFTIAGSGKTSIGNASLSDISINTNFVSKYLSPIAAKINEVLAPIQPILNALTQPVIDLPGLDPLSILDITQALGITDSSDRAFIENLSILSNAVSSIGSSSAAINFGTLDLKGILGNPTGSLAQLSTTNQPTLKSTDEVKTAFYSTIANNSTSQLAGALQFPLFEDPSLLLQLLGGADIDLVKFELPTLSFDAGASYEFPAITVGIASLIIKLFGAISLNLRLGLGYDTFGLRQFQQGGDSSNLANGLYVIDYPQAEASARLELGIGARADVILASAGVTGILFADILADLNDPNKDGKFRLNEIKQQLGSLFTLSGAIGLEAIFDVDVLGVNAADWNLGKVILTTFGSGPNASQDWLPSDPVLFALDNVNSRIILNVGGRALARRTDGQGTVANDGSESFVITNSGTILANAQQYFVSFKSFNQPIDIPGFNKYSIFWQPGEGNDSLVVDAALQLDARTGNGSDYVKANALADTISGEDGSDTLFGGAGDDVLHGGEGADYLYGEAGDDTLYAVDNQRVIDSNGNYIDGGSGSDLILGSDKNDTLIGGDGDDYIASNGGIDSINPGLGSDTVELKVDLKGKAVFSGLTQSGGTTGGESDTIILDYSVIDTSLVGQKRWRLSMGGYGSGSRGDGSSYELLNVELWQPNDADNAWTYDTLYLQDFEQVVVTGTANSDRIVGLKGNDQLNGGAGNDRIISNGGLDAVDGGEGIDFLADVDLSSYSAAIQVNRTTSGLLVQAGVEQVEWRSIENVGNLKTGSGNDTIYLPVFGQFGPGNLLEIYTEAPLIKEFRTIDLGDGSDTLAPGITHGALVGGSKAAETDVLILDYSVIDTSLVGQKKWRLSMSGYGSGVRGDGSSYELLNVELLQPNDADTLITYATLYVSEFEQVVVTGTANSDRIVGLKGNDQLNGGAGNDRIISNGGLDAVDGGEGIDFLADVDLSSYSAAIQVNRTTSGLLVQAGVEQVEWRSIENVGNLKTGSGNDTIYLPVFGQFGPGNLLEIYTEAPLIKESRTIDLGDGSDTLAPGITQGSLIGGSKAAETDVLILDYSVIDTSLVGQKKWRLSMSGYGSGVRGDGSSYELLNVELLQPNDADTLITYATLYVSEFEQVVVTGTANSDRIVGLKGNDQLNGGAGNDRIISNGGLDAVDGGEGIDFLADVDLSSYSAAIQVNRTTSGLLVQAGVEQVEWRSIENVGNLKTGSGNDTIYLPVFGQFGPGNLLEIYTEAPLIKEFRTIDLGDGSDTLAPGITQGSLIGGSKAAETDVLILDYSVIDTSLVGQKKWRLSMSGSGSGVRGDGSSYELLNVELLQPNDADTLITYATLYVSEFEQVVVTGTANSDRIVGLKGNDQLNGGAGNDRIISNGGLDAVDGGEGIDFLADVDLSSYSAAIQVNRTTSGLLVQAGVEQVEWRSIENVGNLKTGSGNDTIYLPVFGQFGPGNFLEIYTEAPLIKESRTIDLGDGSDTLAPGITQGTLIGGSKAAETDVLILDYSVIDTSLVGQKRWRLRMDTYGLTSRADGTTFDYLNVNLDQFSDDGLALTFDTLYIRDFERLIVTGTDNSDLIRGGLGGDVLSGKSGSDTIDGGIGTDTADFSDKTTAVVLTLNGATAATATVGGIAEDTVLNIENISGGTAADSLTGDANANGLYGNGGNDTLNGGAGNDTLRGGLGLDRLDGGLGTDTADFSDKTTAVVLTLNGATAATATVGGIAEDTVLNIEDISGGTAADSLTGDANANGLYGNGGNDTLRGGLGLDRLDGGLGTDTADFSDKTTAVVLTLNGATAATATVGGIAEDTVLNIENISGGTAADSLTGDANGNGLYGNGGNDTLNGGAGNDTLRGGLGLDRLDGGLGTDTADFSDKTTAVVLTLNGATAATATVGGIAEDTVLNIENISGGTAADSLTGDANANGLYGNGGNDTLNGGAGNDTLRGGLGLDRLDGGLGTDTADFSDKTTAVVLTLNGATAATATVGGIAEDTVLNIEDISGGTAADSLTGDANANGLYGNGGNDTLNGGAGNDTLRGGLGLDRLDGGLGTDTADFSDKTTAVVLTLNGATAATATVGGSAEDTVLNIENISGGTAADSLTGDANGNGLYGNGGNDTLNGGAGNDTLRGGLGLDRLDGGLGTDTADFSDKTTAVVLTLNGATAATATVGGSAEDTVLNIEDISGGTAADSLTGDANANGLYGNGGNDTLNGGAGNDTLRGGLGLDRLDGGLGTDTADFSDKTTAVVLTLNGATAATATVGGSAEDTVLNIENISGGTAADSLTGDANGNGLYGNGGNDTLNGGAGNDTLRGGLGLDRLDGGLGTDTADFSDKTTAVVLTLNGATAATATVGGIAEDTVLNIENISGGTAADSLTGDANANGLYGNGGNDTLNGGAGNDTLRGGLGLDRLDGGLGTDTADFSDKTTAVVLTLNGATAATATVGGIAEDTVLNIENISGGTAADSLTGDANGNGLYGNGGNDTLNGGAGNDTLRGGLGLDGLDGGLGTDTADFSDKTTAVVLTLNGATAATATVGGSAEDTVLNIENISGGTAADSLTGDANGNGLYGNGGNDTLSGGAGNDTLRGGLGLDRLDGGLGTDTADFSDKTTAVVLTLNGATAATATVGGIAEDTVLNIENISGGTAADSLTGDANGNGLYGNGGNDTLNGGAGNDTLRGGLGLDRLDGGLGTDTADFSDKTTAVVLTLNGATAATATVGGIAEDTVLNIEDISGGTAADSLTGDANANGLYGNGGNDTLNGGAGNDTLRGGLGLDRLDGGLGTDTADFSDKTTAVVLTLNGATAATATVGGIAEDTVLNIENISGGTAADSLTGDANANGLYGNGGNDTLNGGAGNDTLRGGLGLDRLDGGLGTDTADFSDKTTAVVLTLNGATAATATVGGIAEDTVLNIENISGGTAADSLTGDANGNGLYGGLGNDTLTGGLGADIFRFASALNATTNVDRITDFTPTAVATTTDFIQLENTGAGLFNALPTGTLAATAFTTADFTTAAERIRYDGTTGNLFYDSDGNGAATSILFATLSPNLTTLNNTHFVVT